MPRRRIPLLSLLAALALAACAAPGGFTAAPGGEPAESSAGIQTRAIRSAPATRQASNESRPLSELNTPEAIAARELAKSNGLPTGPIPGAMAAGPGSTAASPRAPGPAMPAATPATGKPAALQKGAKVRLRSGALLAARPSAGSDATPALASEFELGPQIYNAGGYWWYVSSGKESGWALQTDIQP